MQPASCFRISSAVLVSNSVAFLCPALLLQDVEAALRKIREENREQRRALERKHQDKKGIMFEIRLDEEGMKGDGEKEKEEEEGREEEEKKEGDGSGGRGSGPSEPDPELPGRGGVEAQGLVGGEKGVEPEDSSDSAGRARRHGRQLRLQHRRDRGGTRCRTRGKQLIERIPIIHEILLVSDKGRSSFHLLVLYLTFYNNTDLMFTFIRYFSFYFSSELCLLSYSETEKDRAEEEEEDSDVEMDEERLEPRSDDDDTNFEESEDELREAVADSMNNLFVMEDESSDEAERPEERACGGGGVRRHGGERGRRSTDPTAGRGFLRA
ncbi:uncharacterized protein LOC120569504 [Perca fluviatilis]|uniref:uncharacterized protein LOC120569504 n=1 Tax=Perca fluviatilis TaxID=8168 RepID=UPI001962DDFB|nr:uncharacterized protein LOC120569504 [Perca fluviatilis]